MAQKMNPKSYTLLFGVIVFVLTAVGLAFLYYEVLVPPFLFIFAYLVAWVLVFGFAFDFFIIGAKWSRKKFLLFTFVVLIISTTVTHSVWTIVTPRWSFSVITDKNTYRLGENVQITVTLKNDGLIAHSFKSSISDPVVIFIETSSLTSIWYISFHYEITEFTISPNQPLERTFVWNQTNVHYPEKEIEPLTYYIGAHIPGSSSEPFIDYDIFWAWTSINITST